MGYAPTTDVRHPFDSDSNGVAFEIDGTVYMVWEDGNDGYRSSAGPLMSFSGSPYQIGWNNAEYAAWPVVVSHRTKSEYGGEDDVIEIRMAETGDLVLVVGTENVDDYYPSFVASYTPPRCARRQ